VVEPVETPKGADEEPYNVRICRYEDLQMKSLTM
jgi:hypothetical protein